jgi:hypothetical protein
MHGRIRENLDIGLSLEIMSKTLIKKHISYENTFQANRYLGYLIASTATLKPELILFQK